MRDEASEICFDCLEQRIKSDFSDQIVFSYGISDSPLPFGSSAVVKVSDSSGESSASTCESNSPHFVLEYLRKEEHGCLANYVDRFGVEDREGGNSNVAVECDEYLACSSSGSQATEDEDDREVGIGTENFTCGSCMSEHSDSSSCWGTIAALLPIAQVSKCSAYDLEKLASSFPSPCPEDKILASLNRLIDEKPYGQETPSFLHLLGLPLFEEKNKLQCLRHPNLTPVLGLMTSPDCLVSVFPKAPYTLENILYYSPSAIKSEWHRKFMVYQLLSALAHLHELRVSHGNIRPSNILLSDSLWTWLTIYKRPDFGPRDAGLSASRRRWCVEGCYSYGLYADLKISSHLDWQTHFDKWWRGEVSNFEYLLLLNKLAGRRWGDHTFHPVMPWVIDFSQKPDSDSGSGWRDLRKSKWRLAKGDEQLDFTYSTFEIPHHVSDECLSELAVCSYKARRLPLSVLRTAVRSVYEPNEYPSDMQRLYDWTPDECIPEFYCDPRIFYSLHPSMSDLAVPPWASNPEEFIRLHRDALESPHVSSLIHHWIDITFGYKMSGQAAITAKNVMLSSSEPTVLRSVGRRQLFFRPHPVRLGFSHEKEQNRNELEMHTFHGFGVDNKRSVILGADDYLEETEEASAFSEHASHLSPKYHLHQNLVESPLYECDSENTNKADTSLVGTSKNKDLPSSLNLNYLLKHIEVKEEACMEVQELLLWQQDCRPGNISKDIADDIFSIGCLLAELYLLKPLFNSVSLATYLERGDLPDLIEELPPPTKVLVEACIEKDWRRRPTAESLLDSPYFSATVKSAYLFTAPLHLLAKGGTRLYYAASFAKEGALRAMGTFVAEMCAPYCLPLVTSPLSDDECELASVLLKELIKSLTPLTVQSLVLPSIQRILLTTGYSHLKVSLLQDSFVRDLWNQIGKRVYLEMVHPLIISNLYNCPDKISASAASVLLIVSSEELGVPITIHQSILPLINHFGKGICTDGIDVLVRIGRLLGVNFIVKQMLPLLEHVVCFCINLSSMKKPEPIHSWCSVALTDCLTTLDGLVALISDELLIHELTKSQLCLHVRVLMQKNLELRVLQFAATSLMSICQRIGQELTALHVLPQLKELFNELAFSEKSTDKSDSLNCKTTEPIFHPESPIKSRMDLVLLLYPSFASLLGMERLRQSCPTWLLLEQYLLKHHNWKWEYTGRSSRYNMEARPVLNKGAASKHTLSKTLINGSGRPQSEGIRNSSHFKTHIHVPIEGQETVLNPLVPEPWSWFPSPVPCWDGLDIGRFGNPKDEQRWKIKASVLSSAHAHHGALRSLVVSEDECTVFTAGIDPGFKGNVEKWELASLSRVSSYHAHEEVVNDISILSSTGKIASCDGTVHVWNSQTGNRISLFSESPMDQDQVKNNSNQGNRHASNALSSGIFDGSMYTCMHYLEYIDQLVIGTGNGALRFINLPQGEKLQLWRGEPVESGFTSLVSALCSGGSHTKHGDGASSVSPSWIAAGFSSGQCRLFDTRGGSVISSWRAHDGYITKLAAPESHLLVSSSLDKTLRIWDFRK